MPTPTQRALPATVLALAAAGVFQFATPLALCGQESGTIMARARVVEASGAWGAHRLVEERTALFLEGASGARVTVRPETHPGSRVKVEDREGFLAKRRGEEDHLDVAVEPRDANGVGSWPASPLAPMKPAIGVRQAGNVVLQEEHLPSGIRITVADVSR
jgi:hypothetical protein